MSLASFAAAFNSPITFLRVASSSYTGSKPLSTSTPSLLFGRSRTCPIDASTLYSFPRYLLIVFAFAGDSTMTNAFAIEPDWTFVNTLARPAKPYEPPAGHSPQCTSELELDQPQQ